MKWGFNSILFCLLLLLLVGRGQGIIPYQCNNPFYKEVILFDTDSRVNGRKYLLSEGYDKYYKEKKVRGIYVLDSIDNLVVYFKINEFGKIKEASFHSFYNCVKVYYANDTESTVVTSEFNFKGGLLLRKDSVIIKRHRYENMDSIINLENCRLYSYKKGWVINERNKGSMRNTSYNPKKLYLSKRQDFESIWGSANGHIFENDELKNHFFVLNNSQRNLTRTYVEGEHIQLQPKKFYELDYNITRQQTLAFDRSNIVFTKNNRNLNDTVFWDYFPDGKGTKSEKNQRILLYTFRYEYFD